MDRFDVLVIGSGSGSSIVEAALFNNMSVAYVERGPLGGTCLNRGCIPSKMVIYPADVINQIRHAEKLGIKARIEEIDFSFIMERMRRSIEEDRRHMEEGIDQIENLTLFNETGEFVADYTLAVGGETIEAENIFIVSGARPNIPPIKGLGRVDYITSENVWDLTEALESMIIVGGGLVAVEMAHFFSSVGVDITILSRSPRLIKRAEPEISFLLEKAMARRMDIFTGIETREVSQGSGRVNVVARDAENAAHAFEAEALFIAAGRRSNADLLKPERTGVEVDDRGFIRVNEYYETTKERIWAFGDAIGKAMFKHVANKEAGLVWRAFSHGHRRSLDYSKVPYAVFSWPQVGSVGLTEQEALGRGYDILVGVYNYADTAKGIAMAEEDGLVKVVVEDGSYRILGAHIIGSYAPILVQEVTNMMHCQGGTAHTIQDTMHIHPALPEVVQWAFYRLAKPGHPHDH
ncbi:MAG: dihydrolipoyl dehydrogenase [Candidatus Bathyarchaeota archaeon]|nr:dihydrolipoyl dehydrogenase [Candidatus Bathyarchaeota archaeon]